MFGLSKSADRYLAIAATVASLLLLTAFFTSDAFFEWAFNRHRNTASWVARPLLLLPMCYCAWKRSFGGIGVCIFALLSSMFWFPAPVEPREDVTAFLAMERALLGAGWTWSNLSGLIAVMVYAAALLTAFWHRSWKLGLGVAIIGAVGKIAWSLVFSPQAGSAVIPYAVGGALILAAVVFLSRKHLP